MSDPETLGVYNTRGEEYRQRMWDYIDKDPAPKRFLKACPPPGRVLDLGCGPGACAQRFAEAGHQVDAWDAAEAVLSMVPRHERITPRQARFEDVTARAHYDGIWAYFSLLHAPRAAFPVHLEALGRALKPGGVLCLGMKLGENGQRDDLGRYYEYYTVDELEEHLRNAGLTPGEHWVSEGTGLDGQVWPTVVMHAHG